MLVAAGARINNGPHHPNSVGVQFVQIGSHPAAATALPKLIAADTEVCYLHIFSYCCLAQLTTYL
jgi:hypothetical protein